MQVEKRRVSVFAVVGIALVLSTFLMLALPSNRQKRVNEARARLTKAELAAKPFATAFAEKQFNVFSVPYYPGDSYKVVVWNPKSGAAPPDYMVNMPDLRSLSTQKKPAKQEWEIPTSGIIFAPDPKSSSYTDLAVLSVLWAKDKGKWEWLDMLRHELDTTATQPSAVARLKRNLATFKPFELAEARKQIQTNAELCKGLDTGDAFIVFKGKLYVANSRDDYSIKNDYELVYDDDKQTSK